MRLQQKLLNIRGIVTFCFGASKSLIFITPSCTYCTTLGGFVIAQIVLQEIMLWWCLVLKTMCVNHPFHYCV
jgi:hypothetical protein